MRLTLCTLILAAGTAAAQDTMSPEPPRPTRLPAVVKEGKAVVQLAILLDTSGSMNGLIDQARCEIWNVVNELAGAKRNGRPVRLEVGIYQYGSQFAPKSDGYIRLITPFTEDLDEVSRGLFSLSPKGGVENCGQVIDRAATELAWDDEPGTYKVAFIAGNESFDQGRVTFGAALPKLTERAVVLNTVYCDRGRQDPERPPQWVAAASLTGGDYTEIDHNHRLPSVSTPMDPELRVLNRRMNETFVWYGGRAAAAARNQAKQDENAAKMSDRAFAARMSTKIGHLYHHVHSDLVDAVSRGHVKMSELPKAKMPEALREMTPAVREAYVRERVEARKRVRRDMATVLARRDAFLRRKMSKTLGGGDAPTWGEALVRVVRRQAAARGYVFGE